MRNGYLTIKFVENRNFQLYGTFIDFIERLIDLVTGCAIISPWQYFGNRKSVSQNETCK